MKHLDAIHEMCVQKKRPSQAEKKVIETENNQEKSDSEPSRKKLARRMVLAPKSANERVMKMALDIEFVMVSSIHIARFQTRYHGVVIALQEFLLFLSICC